MTTTVEARLGRLEAYREMHAQDIRDIKADVKTIDEKIDAFDVKLNRVLQTGTVLGWLTKGFIPALWSLGVAAGGAALASVPWHTLGH